MIHCFSRFTGFFIWIRINGNNDMAFFKAFV
jgi:hypothetical protein